MKSFAAGRNIVSFLAIAATVVCANVSISQTAWEKHPNNPILVPGPTQWDGLDVNEPTVLLDGTLYKMWYAGCSYKGPNVRNHAIGYATSTDGVVWEKHPSNPVLEPGEAGEWDDYSVTGPTVVFDGTNYRMWYAGYGPGAYATYRIGYATSTDGVVWEKHPSNPVLGLGEAGEWDDAAASQPIVLDGSNYQMWYTGSDGATYRIGYAVSADGVVWEKYSANPVLGFGPIGKWDSLSVFSPTVFFNSTEYGMWYSGSDGIHRIGYATSADGINWSKHPENPVLDGESGEWDFFVYCPTVVSDGTRYEMWYNGYDTKNYRIGYAASVLGIPPVGDAGGPYYGNEGVRFRFDGSRSYDPDGTLVFYDWDFGDGEGEGRPDSIVFHRYGDNGDYAVTLVVTDNDGLTSPPDGTTAIVRNVEPDVEAGSNQIVRKGDPVVLKGSFTDRGTLDTHTALIDWSDGTIEPGIVTEENGSGTVDGSHVYESDGRYTVALAVTDDDGGMDYDTLEVLVVECPTRIVSSEFTTIEDLYQFRDNLLAQNRCGKELIEFYYHHSPEVADILLKHPGISIRATAILEDVMPGIRFLLGNRRGSDIPMTPLRVARIERLFKDIGEQGSEELSEALSMLSGWLGRYRGMRISQIWRAIDKKGD